MTWSPRKVNAQRAWYLHISFWHFLSCRRWGSVVDSPPLAMTWLSNSFFAFYQFHERMIMTYFTYPLGAMNQKPFPPSWSKKGSMAGSANQSNEALLLGKVRLI